MSSKVKEALLFLYRNTSQAFNSVNPLGFTDRDKDFGISLGFTLTNTNDLSPRQWDAAKRLVCRYKLVLSKHGFDTQF